MTCKILTFTPKGIYCPQADIYVDPNRMVENAITTHAHSDHIKKGCRNYFAHYLTVPMILLRAGANIQITGYNYGEEFTRNGVKISLHPAGHIPGSAQVRFEYGGEVAVVSGDYKTEDDGLTTPFEPLKCNTFVTESTFAQPVYKWEEQAKIFTHINNWWLRNSEHGKVSVLTGYSLGKAQRLFKNVDHSIGDIYGHFEITRINELFADAGLELPPLAHYNRNLPAEKLRGSLIIAPPSVIGSDWLNVLPEYSLGFASGWMTAGGRPRRGVHAGFAISDHADWDGLNTAIEQTGAENIYVTHGYTTTLINWLRRNGKKAYDLKFMGDEDTFDANYNAQINLFEK